jgi:NitT/TauT family transport system permease protein
MTTHKEMLDEFDPRAAVDAISARRLHVERREAVIRWVLRVLVTVGFVAVWQYLASRSSPLLLPEPYEVWTATWEKRTFIVKEGWVTLQEGLFGALYGGSGGFFAGILIAHSRRAEAILNPFIIASQSVPKVALAPLFVVWLGFGTAPKIAVAALISFFPLLENTVVGLRRIDPAFVKLFRASGASTWQMFWKLRLVNAAPYILTGARISLLYSLLGAIVGEFIAGNRGLGAAILDAQGLFKTQLMFGLIMSLTMLGILLYGLARGIETIVLRRLHMNVQVDVTSVTP